VIVVRVRKNAEVVALEYRRLVAMLLERLCVVLTAHDFVLAFGGRSVSERVASSRRWNSTRSRRHYSSLQKQLVKQQRFVLKIGGIVEVEKLVQGQPIARLVYIHAVCLPLVCLRWNSGSTLMSMLVH
jgi:hypothetical protein